MRKTIAWLGVAALVGLVVEAAACVGDEPEFPEGADAGPEAQADANADADANAQADANAGAEAGADADAGAEAEADAHADASADAPLGPCTPDMPFIRFENVTELNGPTDDESARLNPEQTAIYFSQRSGPGPSQGGFNVLVATRPDRASAFGSATTLSLGVDPSGPSVSGDGKLLYYASGEGNTPDIRVSTQPFDKSNSTALANIDTDTYWEFNPYVRPDELELYFASNRASSEDIYVTARGNGDFAGVTPIAAANGTSSNERTPVVTADGLTLYFASDRSGNWDVYVVRRTAVANAFAEPVGVVTELNTSSNEFPDWISPDQCTMYFRSDRIGGSGGRDIWRALRR